MKHNQPKKHYPLFLAMGLLLITGQLNAQVEITGKAVSEDGTGVGAIHILAYQYGDKSIKAFAITKPDGSFSLDVKVMTDSLFIKTSSINYQNQTIALRNESQELKIVLKPDVKQLQGVTVATHPIAKYGDTLSYLVRSFVRENDRSIEDVLKRMPGITVDPNGQILYQDIPINKLYIEGMDITGGNYGVVSKNLPQGSVAAVEVFENHQPVKILQDVQFSSQAALNLKLKNKIATTGSASAGIGAAPFLWQFNCTPLIFTKKNQFIVSLQGNNTGNDILQQTYSFDGITQMELEAEQKKLVDVVSATVPEISAARYLDNKTWLLNLNSLHYLNSDLQLKTNVSLTDDKRTSGASETKTIYTPTDTIETKSIFDNNASGRTLTSKVTLNRNTRENYINNETNFRIKDNKATGNSFYNQQDIVQRFENPSFRLSNGFRLIKLVGRKFLHLNSDVLFVSGDQSLYAAPVQVADSFLIANQVDSVRQQVHLSRFFTVNSAKMGFSIRKFLINNELGFSYKRNLLTSDLLMFSSAGQQFSDSAYINDLTSHSLTPFFETEIKLKNENYTLSTSGKIGYTYIYSNDQKANTTARYRHFLHEVGLSLFYKLTAFWQLRMSASHENQPDDINNIYPGYILSNYRQLERMDKPFSSIDRYRFYGFISYRNSMIAFFNSLSYTLMISSFDYSGSNEAGINGSTVGNITSVPSQSYYQNLSGYSSKYLSWLKSTISIKANAGFTKGTSFLNNVSIETRNQTFMLNPGIMFRVAWWMNLDYTSSFIWMNSFLQGKPGNKMSMYKQYFSLFMFPFKNQSFNLSAEYYVYDNQEYLFSDVSYQYTLSKPKMDVQLTARNIFNSDSYTSLYINNYYAWVYKYNLRPFEILLSLKFTF